VQHRLDAALARIAAIEAVLRERNIYDPPANVVEGVTPKQAMYELGMSRSGVQWLISDGRLKRVKAGGRVLIDRDSLQSYKLLAGRKMI
jgi:excisionase family DNA binding protein